MICAKVLRYSHGGPLSPIVYILFSACIVITASISLIITAATMDNAAAIMLIPTFLAVIVSGWMNLVLFWNRLEAKSKEAAVNRFQLRRLATLRALKLEY